MATMQLATRVEEEDGIAFKETARKLGMTPADALRIFVASFNENKGFPYMVQLHEAPEPFASEKEATDFVNARFKEAVDEAW